MTTSSSFKSVKTKEGANKPLPFYAGFEMFLLHEIPIATVTAGNVSGTAIKVMSPPAGGSQYAKRTFQGLIRTTTGSVAATCTITVQVSNDPLAESVPASAGWITLGTITLNGTATTTTPATDGFASEAVWKYVRGYVAQNSLTGANTVVSLIMGA